MQWTLMKITLSQDLGTRPSRYVWEQGERKREKGGEGGRGEDEGGGEQACTIIIMP